MEKVKLRLLSAVKRKKKEKVPYYMLLQNTKDSKMKDREFEFGCVCFSFSLSSFFASFIVLFFLFIVYSDLN